jgi:putative mRNA 3-end processing factor
MSLIEFTDRGLYCRQGNFYIDPWKPVERAVITHAHSDHAKAGHGNYLCHKLTAPLIRARLGEHNIQSVGWDEPVHFDGIKLSLHPAGHIIGSSQVRIESNGEVWVFTGDFKTENDGLSGEYEPQTCQVMITESTFALPIYQWKTQPELFDDINRWILANQAEERNSVLIAYSLGKAQRVLQAVSSITDNIFVHGAVWNAHQALVSAGVQLPAVKKVELGMTKSDFKSAVIIAPPGAESSAWMKRFTPYSVGICSGWMQVRGNARRKNADMGFALSDHADWNGLQWAVKESGAEKVFVTHGFQSVFTRYLCESGIAAQEVKTEYGNDEETEPGITADEQAQTE